MPASIHAQRRLIGVDFFHMFGGNNVNMRKEHVDLLVDIIGWIGSFEILLAYGLNSYQKIRSDSLNFLLLNLTGGLLLILYTFYKGAFANTFLNVVWVVIAVAALIKLYLQRPEKNPQP